MSLFLFLLFVAFFMNHGLLLLVRVWGIHIREYLITSSLSFGLNFFRNCNVKSNADYIIVSGWQVSLHREGKTYVKHKTSMFASRLSYSIILPLMSKLVNWKNPNGWIMLHIHHLHQKMPASPNKECPICNLFAVSNNFLSRCKQCQNINSISLVSKSTEEAS